MVTRFVTQNGKVSAVRKTHLTGSERCVSVHNSGGLTPTATPAQRKERLAAVEALALQRWTEALEDHRATDAKSYAISAAIAVDKAQLLEGLPTEILGGLPEYQGSLTAILARVERVHGQPLALLPPSTSTTTPTTSDSTSTTPKGTTSSLRQEHNAPMGIQQPRALTVQDSSTARAEPPKQVATLTGGPLVKPRRRLMGRKDRWTPEEVAHRVIWAP